MEVKKHNNVEGYHHYLSGTDLNPEQYAEKKIRMLIRDFGFVLRDEEIEHIKSLKTDNAIDRAARKIIFERLK